MSQAESNPTGFDVVVGTNGISISSEALAELGIRPGTHLRLVPETTEPVRKFKSIEGRLVGKIDSDALDAALDWNKEQRIAAVMDEDGE
jgi:hypothetical protein